MIRRRYRFHGKVQGVGFRNFCQEAALSRDTRGWVRNLPDGSVEMEAEAAENVLEDLLRHVLTRHPWARVDKWDALDMSPRKDEAEGFEIRF
jgi:acylphosphatase